MYSWMDVKPGDWFYNDVMEVTNIDLPDGSRLVNGMVYTEFVTGKPYVYKEIQAKQGTVSYKLDSALNNTPDNPVIVWVDGVRTLFKTITVGSDGLPVLELFTAPKAGAVISIGCPGVASVDATTKRPVPNDPAGAPHPHGNLYIPSGEYYVFRPYDGRNIEYVTAFGKRLRRVEPKPGQSYDDAIGFLQDVYAIDIYGKIYLPYNLNHVRVIVTYYTNLSGQRVNHIIPNQDKVYMNNRYFPDAQLTRAEFVTLLWRMRQNFYMRFTDYERSPRMIDETVLTYLGQQMFVLEGYYVMGGGLTITCDGKTYRRNTDYEEISTNKVKFYEPFDVDKKVQFKFTKTSSVRFKDVPSSTFGFDAILDMEEDECQVLGRVLLPPRGGASDEFRPEQMITRIEAVSMLNRFRTWCLERFI